MTRCLPFYGGDKQQEVKPLYVHRQQNDCDTLLVFVAPLLAVNLIRINMVHLNMSSLYLSCPKAEGKRYLTCLMLLVYTSVDNPLPFEYSTNKHFAKLKHSHSYPPATHPPKSSIQWVNISRTLQRFETTRQFVSARYTTATGNLLANKALSLVKVAHLAMEASASDIPHLRVQMNSLSRISRVLILTLWSVFSDSHSQHPHPSPMGISSRQDHRYWLCWSIRASFLTDYYTNALEGQCPG